MKTFKLLSLLLLFVCHFNSFSQCGCVDALKISEVEELNWNKDIAFNYRLASTVSRTSSSSNASTSISGTLGNIITGAFDNETNESILTTMNTRNVDINYRMVENYIKKNYVPESSLQSYYQCMRECLFSIYTRELGDERFEVVINYAKGIGEIKPAKVLTFDITPNATIETPTRVRNNSFGLKKWKGGRTITIKRNDPAQPITISMEIETADGESLQASEFIPAFDPKPLTAKDEKNLSGHHANPPSNPVNFQFETTTYPEKLHVWIVGDRGSATFDSQQEDVFVWSVRLFEFSKSENEWVEKELFESVSHDFNPKLTFSYPLEKSKKYKLEGDVRFRWWGNWNNRGRFLAYVLKE